MIGTVRRVAAGAASQSTADSPGVGPSVPGALPSDPVKTRTLIVLALLCGMALVIAFTVQILLAPR